MSKFELSLAENYVQDWTIVEAVREFFQNAVDQQTLIKNNDMFFKYDQDEQILHIGNKSSVLEANSLLLGTSSKTNNDETIGRFGEGYKIATLVAIREGKEVVFYNYGKKEIWKPRMVKSRKYNANILTFFTEKYLWKKVPDNYLTIEIKGVTKEEYDKIVESNLHLQNIGEIKNSTYGKILVDEKYKGCLYVNGLFVKKIVDLNYGYDILPKYLKLDRDRKMVDSFDVKYITSMMWKENKDSEEDIIKLAKENRGDISFAYNMDISENKAREEVFNFMTEHGGNAVPVSSNEEIKEVQSKYKDAVPVMVSEVYRDILKSSKDYNPKVDKKELITMEHKLKNWVATIRDKITDQEYEEFLNILDEEYKDMDTPF